MDITLRWNPLLQRADWFVQNGGLALGLDLESAVIISLFTDRVKSPDFVPTDGTTDPRGWWADAFRPRKLGSRLWELERVKKTDQKTIPLRARDYCREALQWALDDGVAASIVVTTGWVRPDMLGIKIVITKPDGSLAPFSYDWAWQGVLN